jgi:hypothetical protein
MGGAGGRATRDVRAAGERRRRQGGGRTQVGRAAVSIAGTPWGDSGRASCCIHSRHAVVAVARPELRPPCPRSCTHKARQRTHRHTIRRARFWRLSFLRLPRAHQAVPARSAQAGQTDRDNITRYDPTVQSFEVACIVISSQNLLRLHVVFFFFNRIKFRLETTVRA